MTQRRIWEVPRLNETLWAPNGVPGTPWPSIYINLVILLNCCTLSPLCTIWTESLFRTGCLIFSRVNSEITVSTLRTLVEGAEAGLWVSPNVLKYHENITHLELKFYFLILAEAKNHWYFYFLVLSNMKVKFKKCTLPKYTLPTFVCTHCHIWNIIGPMNHFTNLTDVEIIKFKAYEITPSALCFVKIAGRIMSINITLQLCTFLSLLDHVFLLIIQLHITRIIKNLWIQYHKCYLDVILQTNLVLFVFIYRNI